MWPRNRHLRDAPVRWSLAMMTVAVLLLGTLPAMRGQEPRAEAVAAPQASHNSPRLTGVASCSAQACHGDTRRDDAFPEIWGNEHTIWVQDDPHARSYIALFDQRSLEMAERLKIGKPYQAQVCLSCHAPSGQVRATVGTFEPSDAVGCESCHGAAEHWLAAHTERDWRQKSAGQKAALGLRNTEDPLARAQLCAGCHVGGLQGPRGARDVNHDLIAAGHPRLQFELTAYLSQLRRHWDEKADDPSQREYDPSFHTRLWAVGQAVSAQAAVELLAERTAGPSPAWPELAEFDCYSCHHQLGGNGWRQSPEYLDFERKSGKPGSLRWGTWYVAMFSPLNAMSETLRLPAPPMQSVAELTRVMQSGAVAASEAHDRAQVASKELSAWARELNQASYPQAGTREMMRALLAQPLLPWSWDSAAQHYLSLRTLDLSYKYALERQMRKPSSTDEQITSAIQDIRALISFPTERGVRFDSPRDYHPQKIQKQFAELRRLLNPP